MSQIFSFPVRRAVFMRRLPNLTRSHMREVSVRLYGKDSDKKGSDSPQVDGSAKDQNSPHAKWASKFIKSDGKTPAPPKEPKSDDVKPPPNVKETVKPPANKSPHGTTPEIRSKDEKNEFHVIQVRKPEVQTVGRKKTSQDKCYDFPCTDEPQGSSVQIRMDSPQRPGDPNEPFKVRIEGPKVVPPPKPVKGPQITILTDEELIKDPVQPQVHNKSQFTQPGSAPKPTPIPKASEVKSRQTTAKPDNVNPAKPQNITTPKTQKTVSPKPQAKTPAKPQTTTPSHQATTPAPPNKPSDFHTLRPNPTFGGKAANPAATQQNQKEKHSQKSESFPVKSNQTSNKSQPIQAQPTQNTPSKGIPHMQPAQPSKSPEVKKTPEDLKRTTKVTYQNPEPNKKELKTPWGASKTSAVKAKPNESKQGTDPKIQAQDSIRNLRDLFRKHPFSEKKAEPAPKPPPMKDAKQETPNMQPNPTQNPTPDTKPDQPSQPFGKIINPFQRNKIIKENPSKPPDTSASSKNSPTSASNAGFDLKNKAQEVSETPTGTSKFTFSSLFDRKVGKDDLKRSQVTIPNSDAKVPKESAQLPKFIGRSPVQPQKPENYNSGPFGFGKASGLQEKKIVEEKKDSVTKIKLNPMAPKDVPLMPLRDSFFNIKAQQGQQGPQGHGSKTPPPSQGQAQQGRQGHESKTSPPSQVPPQNPPAPVDEQSTIAQPSKTSETTQPQQSPTAPQTQTPQDTIPGPVAPADPEKQQNQTPNKEIIRDAKVLERPEAQPAAPQPTAPQPAAPQNPPNQQNPDQPPSVRAQYEAPTHFSTNQEQNVGGPSNSSYVGCYRFEFYDVDQKSRNNKNEGVDQKQGLSAKDERDKKDGKTGE